MAVKELKPSLLSMLFPEYTFRRRRFYAETVVIGRSDVKHIAYIANKSHLSLSSING
jgi:hypothetical protein